MTCSWAGSRGRWPPCWLPATETTGFLRNPTEDRVFAASESTVSWIQSSRKLLRPLVCNLRLWRTCSPLSLPCGLTQKKYHIGLGRTAASVCSTRDDSTPLLSWNHPDSHPSSSWTLDSMSKWTPWWTTWVSLIAESTYLRGQHLWSHTARGHSGTNCSVTCADWTVIFKLLVAAFFSYNIYIYFFQFIVNYFITVSSTSKRYSLRYCSTQMLRI